MKRRARKSRFSEYELSEKLTKTKENFLGKIAEILNLRNKIDANLLEELEEVMLQADIGIKTCNDVINKLRDTIKAENLTEPAQIKDQLENIIRRLLLHDYADNQDFTDKIDKSPYIILFAGVNGVGKTTTIGKLAKRYHDLGKSVIMIAGDTFRAAAIEQLDIWAERAGAILVKQQQGSDPSSVVYDGLQSALHKKIDIVLIDTAGRQHTKVNLMNELSKIVRTIKKVIPDAPHETLLVVDATTGQNAISQAEIFHQAIDLSGLILTKMDGTAKGGIVIGIKHQLGIPVRMIGVGEAMDDLRKFDVNEFVDAIFK
jgi:fused signal recognition particle receptor